MWSLLVKLANQVSLAIFYCLFTLSHTTPYPPPNQPPFICATVHIFPGLKKHAQDQTNLLNSCMTGIGPRQLLLNTGKP